MYKITQTLCTVCIVTCLAAFVTGCKSNDAPPLNLKDGGTTGSNGTGSPYGDGGREQTTIDGLPVIDDNTIFAPAQDMDNVYFDYNSFTLNSEARAALERNASRMKQEPRQIFQIEGHCDERGTQEYNLALGEKRALATREYLMQLGVSGDRLITISYGEEAPEEYGNNEAAWSKNRRAEFNRATT